MFRKIATTAIVLALATPLAFTQEARAEAAEFFKCRLVEGGSIENLVAIANDFEAIVAENGLEDYNVSFLTPLYASDLKEGTFWWVGIAQNYSGAGRANEIWESSAGDGVRARWDENIRGCENSSLYSLTRTPNGDED